MPKFVKKVSKKIGLSPGALVHIGKKKIEKVRIRLIDYDEAQLQEKEAKTIEECFLFKERPMVIWINIDRIHQVEIMKRIGKHFYIHPHVLEYILSTGQCRIWRRKKWKKY